MAKVFIDITPLRRFPQYRRLWFGYAISLMGSQLTTVAVAWQVYTITHSVFDVGLVSLAQLGPAIVAPVIGGSVADAMDRRKLLMITNLAMALCSTGLALNAIGGHAKLWPIFVLAAATAGFSGIDGPTRTAVQMNLVGRDSFVAANVLRQILMRMAVIVGPSIGGILIASFPITIVFWVDVASFSAAMWAVVRLDPLPPADGGTKFGLKSIAEGFAFLKGRQAIQGCFIADLNATILGLPTSLFPFMAIHHFHGGSRAYGLLVAAPGVGATIGSLISGWSTNIRRQGLAVLVSITIWGISLAAFGIVPFLWAGVILLGIAGWADLISATFRNTIIQVEAPDRLRGRLSSISAAVVQSGPRLGNFEAGGVAALSSTEISIVVGGLGCVLGAVLVGKFMPKFTGYELRSDGEASDSTVALPSAESGARPSRS